MPEESPSFLDRLRHRRVPHVALVYGATAFAVVEAADLVVPRLGLPDWTVTLVLVLGLLGFPIALVLAWALEITPEGVRRTRTDAPPEGAPDPRWVSTRSAVGAGLLVLVGLGVGWLAGRTGVGPATGGADAPGSVAVLPFVNMSGSEENEYFSDGLAEEILNLLAKVEDLKVPARTSSFAYRGQNQDIRTIARELGVGAVLEGSVRRAGDDIRVTAQLIQASDGYHLWSETYDRRLEDVFAIQEDIAGEIVAALRTELDVEDPRVVARGRPTDDLDAYQLFLQARHLFHQRTQPALERSVGLFRDALELDPGFAEAWVGLAMAYSVIPGYGDFVPDSEARAREAAERGLALDPTLALGHATLGNLFTDRGDFVDAHRAFRRARELDPVDPTILLWHAIMFLNSGLLDEGGAALDRAFELDPASGVIVGWKAHHELLRENADEALELYRQSADLGWGAGPLWLCYAGASLGRYDELREACDPERAGAARLASLGDLLRHLEAVMEAEPAAAATAIREGSRPQYGTVLAPMLGDAELFFSALEYHIRGQGNLSTVAMWRSAAAPFRSDPRFADWVERRGLPPLWDEVRWPAACSRDGGVLRCR